MRDDDFEFWLANTYRTKQGEPMQSSTVKNTLADCRLVEKHEGDLDEHYRKDGMRSLLARFAYTRNEEARRVKPRHNIPINGCWYEGTAARKTAINRYRDFLTST